MNSIEDFDECDNSPQFFKRKEKKRLRIEKELKQKLIADEVVNNLLQNNPNINVGFVIDKLKNSIFSTNECCTKLKISHAAFLRLRRKYNIEPVYTASIRNTLKKIYGNRPNVQVPRQAIKNFYTDFQMSKIPQEEIVKVQMRAARSLKFPNGKDVPLEWVPRGIHDNGKLKARTSMLEKFGWNIAYDPLHNKYLVKSKDDAFFMSKKEVDIFNLKISRLKSFA